MCEFFARQVGILMHRLSARFSVVEAGSSGRTGGIVCCFVAGTRAPEWKSTAIPELLAMRVITGAIRPIDAIGTQMAIAAKIVAREANYVGGSKAINVCRRGTCQNCPFTGQPVKGRPHRSANGPRPKPNPELGPRPIGAGEIPAAAVNRPPNSGSYHHTNNA
jgi:hypothetical protein